MKAVALIEKMKTRFALPYRALVEDTNLGYASFMRWKRRMALCKPPVKSPGPKKVAPLDLKDLTRKVESLHHGKKRSQGELKGFLNTWRGKAGSLEQLFLLVETAAHDLNHKPRRSLGGRTACQRYFGNNRMRYSKRKRRAAYRWIRDLAIDLNRRVGEDTLSAATWRIAAKTWLVKNKLVTILKPGKVLPHFSSILCHN